jgi:hypothetical protein
VGGQAVGHAINPCETRRGWGASWCARSVPEGKGSRIKYALSEDVGEERGPSLTLFEVERFPAEPQKTSGFQRCLFSRKGAKTQRKTKPLRLGDFA